VLAEEELQAHNRVLLMQQIGELAGLAGQQAQVEE
jgi:hypothetical protein